MSRRKPEPVGLYSLRCETCGAYLVPTGGAFLACPAGHGRLHVEQPERPEVDEASLFDPEELEAQ